MIWALLACAPPLKTITLPATPACMSKQVSMTLPERNVREVQVLEGELMVRARGRDLELRLPATKPSHPSVLLSYRAGPFARMHRARIVAPRERSVESLPPEPATWRIVLNSMQLGGAATSRANVLGFEGEIEARLELCVASGACKSLTPGQMIWAPAEQARHGTMRLRDQDLLFSQKISDRHDYTLSAGLNELDIEGSHLSIKVHAFSPLPSTPQPLALGKLTSSQLSYEGAHPQAWLVELDAPATLHVALISPSGEVELTLHGCDGGALAQSSWPASHVALLQEPLPEGRWLIRAGLKPRGVGLSDYEIVATTELAQLQQILAEQGIVLQ